MSFWSLVIILQSVVVALSSVIISDKLICSLYVQSKSIKNFCWLFFYKKYISRQHTKRSRCTGMELILNSYTQNCASLVHLIIGPAVASRASSRIFPLLGHAKESSVWSGLVICGRLVRSHFFFLFSYFLFDLRG